MYVFNYEQFGGELNTGEPMRCMCIDILSFLERENRTLKK